MSELTKKDGKGPERINDAPIIEVGQWYWVHDPEDHPKRWFGCVTEIGSNYVELKGVPHGNSQYVSRVHMDRFPKVCVIENGPESVIRKEIEFYRGVVQGKISEIKEITARLGVSKSLKIEQAPAEESCRALSVLSGTKDAKAYKKDLIKAKEKDLPKLFEELKEANENMAAWMSAQALPMMAVAEGMKGCIEEIEGRVFNVSLYAGLTEEVVQFASGNPAPCEKLRIMQRLLYMDEECLLDYRHGGMSFRSIKQFDQWMAKPANRDRVFPFPRTIVAFRVRRDFKEREWDGTLAGIQFNWNEEQLDKLTFLYIRNGDNLYRLNCDLEFGNLIFPGKAEGDLNEPMMAEMFADRVEKIIPRREYEDLLKEHEENKRKCNEWTKANPGKGWIENPFRVWPMDRYESFDPSSVYYDDIKKEITKRVTHYNRIALIVQGLFDRSPIFHPHPPVRLWNPEGFSAAVELVYDGAGVLHYGQAPDFEEYRKSVNAALCQGSITVGQDDFWQEKEAVKESGRMDRDWRTKTEYRPRRFTPYGNPGPGYLAKVARWMPQVRKAVFEWRRKRLRETWRDSSEESILCALAVPDSRILNVSAYKPGDFRRFFEDPRTRAAYLKWAPMLLAAEEYHAGNFKVGAKE